MPQGALRIAAIFILDSAGPQWTKGEISFEWIPCTVVKSNPTALNIYILKYFLTAVFINLKH